MRRFPAHPFPGTLLMLALLGLLLGTGCATRKIDWSTRVGKYTFDDAVKEFGPPDKQARLTDGTTVYEWLTRRGGGGGDTVFFPAGSGFFSRSLTSAPDVYLRLSFDPDSRLKEAKTIYK